MSTIETKELLPYQQRVVDEKTELDAKLGNLITFLHQHDAIQKAGRAEYDRLCRQRGVMEMYSDILTERINAF